MNTSTKKKNAIERFKERSFRSRVFLFLGIVIAWLILLFTISANKQEKETAYSLQAYWISSTFFIFITFKLMFKRYNQ